MEDKKKVENSDVKKSSIAEEARQKVRISGYISLVIAILFFSGIFNHVSSRPFTNPSKPSSFFPLSLSSFGSRSVSCLMTEA